MTFLRARGRTLSVMSANLRYPARDGNPWSDRVHVWAELISAELPHVIGTQEGVVDQIEELVALLPKRYAWTGEGRAGGDAGEFTAVIFDAQRLDAESVDVRWISTEPEVPGSRSWGSSHPRTITRVDFRDRVGGHALRVVNTHIDHRSDEARPHAAAMLLADARAGRENGAEVVVTGDFNVDQYHSLHTALVADGILTDAVDSAEAGTVANADVNTFHFYRGVENGDRRIDWVLHTDGLRVEAAGTNTFCRDGCWPSDHFPVQALLQWTAEGDGQVSQTASADE